MKRKTKPDPRLVRYVNAQPSNDEPERFDNRVLWPKQTGKEKLVALLLAPLLCLGGWLMLIVFALADD